MLMFLKSYLPLAEQLYGSIGKKCCLLISKILHVNTLLSLSFALRFVQVS